MFSEHFLVALASRMFDNTPAAWSSFQVGLACAAYAGLDTFSSVAMLDELSVTDAPGYARVGGTFDVVDDSTGAPIAKLNVPAVCWTNSGDKTWPEVSLVFVTAIIDGTQRFIYAAEVNPLKLEAGKTLGLAGNCIPFYFAVSSNG